LNWEFITEKIEVTHGGFIPGPPPDVTRRYIPGPTSTIMHVWIEINDSNVSVHRAVALTQEQMVIYEWFLHHAGDKSTWEPFLALLFVGKEFGLVS
jgi:hypothetical protein